MRERVTVVTLSVSQSVAFWMLKMAGFHVRNGHLHKLGDDLKVLIKCGSFLKIYLSLEKKRNELRPVEHLLVWAPP